MRNPFENPELSKARRDAAQAKRLVEQVARDVDELDEACGRLVVHFQRDGAPETASRIKRDLEPIVRRLLETTGWV